MRIRFNKNKVDSFRALSNKMWNSWQGKSQQSINFDGKAIAMADQSKPSTNGNVVQSNRTNSKQISPQPSRTFGDTNFLSRLVVSDKVSACGRESRSDCPGVGYPVFYSFVAQLKSWTWRPYSTNPTKKLSNGNLEKSLVGHFEHSLHHKFKTTLSKRSAEVNMRTIQASVAVRPQFLSLRPWISGLFQQYWKDGFAV